VSYIVDIKVIYKTQNYFFSRHIDITNIEEAVDTRNSGSGDGNLLEEIRHIRLNI
jgi:hypothetical protein